MSRYRTISSDYRVLKLDDEGEIIGPVYAGDPLYNAALDVMADSFNRMHLEQYIDDRDAQKALGRTVKAKIKSITMERTHRLDAHGMPCIRITVESYPSKLRMTQKVRDFLDDYITAQFCDGWGEGFFYPYNNFVVNGQRLAVEQEITA